MDATSPAFGGAKDKSPSLIACWALGGSIISSTEADSSSCNGGTKPATASALSENRVSLAPRPSEGSTIPAVRGITTVTGTDAFTPVDTMSATRDVSSDQFPSKKRPGGLDQTAKHSLPWANPSVNWRYTTSLSA
eukprot:2224304-Rhodomonas_salina.1